MTRHLPFWLDRCPKSTRPAYPVWHGEGEAGTVVIGGGLAGCCCAFTLAAAGIDVVLLEADRLGAGASADATGLVRVRPAVPFAAAARSLGLRTARAIWQGHRKAALDLAATLRRLRIRSELAAVDLLQLSGAEAEASARLKREYQGQHDAGIAVTWTNAAQATAAARFPANGAIKSKGFSIDPYRTTLGIAAAAVQRKARVFERTMAVRVRDRRSHVEVQTDSGGLIRAQSVVIATSAGLHDFRALRRHLHSWHGYAVVSDSLPAAIRREAGPSGAAVEDDRDPPHVVRCMTEERLLVAGASQLAVPARSQSAVLEQRTGQLMYELSTLYPAISGVSAAWSWHYRYDVTPDGLPLLGPHRNFPRHFFVLGQSAHGPASSWLAARLVQRWAAEKMEKSDELYGFARILDRNR